jgi:hypothetical protein
VPAVSHVMRVVEARLNAGPLQCLVPGCGGVLAPWWYGIERALVLAGGASGRVRPRRPICKSCGTTRVLLPGTVLRRRQCPVEVIGTALLHAAAGMPWTRVAARAGVPFETVRGWLRGFTRRADLVRGWLPGLLDVLAGDPRLPGGAAGPAAGALAVPGELCRQLAERWPLVAGLSRWQLAARLSRGGLLSPAWPPGAVSASSPVAWPQAGRHRGWPGLARGGPPVSEEEPGELHR